MDGREERLEPIATEVLQPGERLGHLLSGGGGYGDPRQREPEPLREDVPAGIVSFERTRDVYGVVFRSEVMSDQLEVDAKETARRRAAAQGQ